MFNITCPSLFYANRGIAEPTPAARILLESGEIRESALDELNNAEDGHSGESE
jgi:hypothetical protein